MRIAIVDDIASERENLHRRLDIQLARLALPAEISEFESGKEFLSAAEIERFNLTFMDIYMENENGVDTAQELRRFDTDCLLVFTTASTDHALDGFRVRAMQYLVKPYSDEDLAALFDEIVNRLPLPEKYLELNTVRLPFTKIQYAEHYRHHIYIYTVDGQKVVIRQTFREFTKELSDDRFFRCNRGVIVNLKHVKDFNGTDFILNDGKKLSVSRSLSKSARIAFTDFLFREGLRP